METGFESAVRVENGFIRLGLEIADESPYVTACRAVLVLGLLAIVGVGVWGWYFRLLG